MSYSYIVNSFHLNMNIEKPRHLRGLGRKILVEAVHDIIKPQNPVDCINLRKQKERPRASPRSQRCEGASRPFNGGDRR